MIVSVWFWICSCWIDSHVSSGWIVAITSERSLFRNINSIEDFFRQMLDKRVLNERNVIIVQYLMRQIGRPDLEEMCFEYASKSKQVLCYHENPRCQGSFIINLMDSNKCIILHCYNNGESMCCIKKIYFINLKIISFFKRIY